MPKIQKLTDLCLQSICKDTNEDRKYSAIDYLKKSQLRFPNQWSSLILEINVEADDGQNERVRMNIDQNRSEFEGTAIMTPLQCLYQKPSHIELRISRTPSERGLCMITWYLHYRGYDNAFLEVSYDITNSRRINLSLRLESDWNARDLPDMLICEFHSNKWNRRFFRMLANMYLSKSLHQVGVLNPCIANTWPKVKEFVQNIMNKNHENVLLDFNVMENNTFENSDELSYLDEHISLKMQYL